MAIYLGGALPPRSSHLPGETGPVMLPSTVLLRIEFTAANCRQNTGRSLTPPFHPYCKKYAAVYLCCTCPDVAIGGCYPLSLPYGARTFLTHSLSARARGHSENSLIFKKYTKYAVLYSLIGLSFRKSQSSGFSQLCQTFCTSSLSSNTSSIFCMFFRSPSAVSET